MNRGLALGAGLGIGTGLMYLFDPDRGKRRRALLRDKVVWAKQKSAEEIETTARDLSNRASGIAASIRSRFTSDEADDVVLVERVRSKLGRIVSHPGSLAIYGATRRDALGAGFGAVGLLLLTRGITNTEFRRLAGLGDGEKIEDGSTHPEHDASSVENLFAQSSAAM